MKHYNYLLMKERCELIDTQNVALRYTIKDLEFIEDASLAQFYELPVSTYVGYISEFNLDIDVFHLDRVEWITSEQVERMKELGLSEEDMLQIPINLIILTDS